MNNLEIERKFLVVDDSYKQLAINHYTIIQGYICRESGRTVRVRLKSDSNGLNTAFLTIKGKPADGMLARFEWEKEISPDEAEKLLALCDRTIDKTRYIVPVGEHVFEVDQFHGNNEGLVLAEVELSSEAAATACRSVQLRVKHTFSFTPSPCGPL
jgi:CYTH domain-containing protein